MVTVVTVVTRLEGMKLEPNFEHRVVVWPAFDGFVDSQWFGSEC